MGLHVSVPNAGSLLADWGAQVIKIEDPGGDGWRKQGWIDSLPIEDECNPEFTLVNSGKRLLCLDLKKSADEWAVLQLSSERRNLPFPIPGRRGATHGKFCVSTVTEKKKSVT